jgi:hypothetical protein
VDTVAEGDLAIARLLFVRCANCINVGQDEAASKEMLI